MNLRPRLLLYFFFLSIVPVLLIGIVSYSLSFNIIKNKSIKFNVSVINQVADEINIIISEALSGVDRISAEPNIQESLRKIPGEDIIDRYKDELAIDTRLAFIERHSISPFFGFYVIGTHGQKYKSNNFSIKNLKLEASSWYRDIINSTEGIWFDPHKDSYVVVTVSGDFVTFGYPIIDKATGKPLGVAIVEIEKRKIDESMNKINLGEAGEIFIVNEEDKIIFHSNESKAEKYYVVDEKKQADMGYIGNSNLTYAKKLKNGWKIVGVISWSELIKDNIKIGIIILIALIFITVFASLASIQIANSVGQPVNHLITLMEQVEKGDLTVKMNVKYNDEISVLGNKFNLMIDRISGLMNQIYIEQRNYRIAELKALQAQINPHFLYNTLDSIAWKIRLDNNDSALKMIMALTTLFRIGISKGKEIISIHEELEHVKSYLEIQKIRYEDKLTFDIQVAENLYEYKIVKLVLQPLVENCIYHGIKEKDEKGTILIKVLEDQQHVIFKVIDDGIGMSKKEVEVVNDLMQQAAPNTIDSFGLINVNERIKIYFGNEYGLSFSSEYGVGTTVTLRIPKTLEELNHD